MSERTYERRCESCIHFVPYPESKEFDICKIQGSSYEIYRELPYDKCTAYEHNEPVAAEIFKAQNHDAVNHPLHYTTGSIECIEALKAATTRLRGIEAVCTANAIKYLWRWKDKNGAEDIRKAIWYCERLLKEIGDEQT